MVATCLRLIMLARMADMRMVILRNPPWPDVRQETKGKRVKLKWSVQPTTQAPDRYRVLPAAASCLAAIPHGGRPKSMGCVVPVILDINRVAKPPGRNNRNPY